MACTKVVRVVEYKQPCSVLATAPVTINAPLRPRVIARDWRDRIPVVTPPVMRYETRRRASRGSATVVTNASPDLRGVLLRTPKINEMMMDALDSV